VSSTQYRCPMNVRLDECVPARQRAHSPATQKGPNFSLTAPFFLVNVSPGPKTLQKRCVFANYAPDLMPRGRKYICLAKLYRQRHVNLHFCRSFSALNS
jgi:hypothetical protein